jgi:hypothetical protein
LDRVPATAPRTLSFVMGFNELGARFYFCFRNCVHACSPANTDSGSGNSGQRNQMPNDLLRLGGVVVGEARRNVRHDVHVERTDANWFWIVAGCA